MGLLTREMLLKKEDLKREKVDLGNGDYVFVREMTGRERDRFENSVLSREVKGEDGKLTFERSLEDFRAKLAVNSMCDENGELLLKPEDASVLSTRMSGRRLVLISDAAQRVSRISPGDRDDLVKNSEGGQAASSTSGSAKS